MPSVMAGLRSLCAERSVARATEFAGRLAATLSAFRASDPSRSQSPAPVSMALDEFIDEVRSTVELAAAPSEPSSAEVGRVGLPLATLNQMYVASEEALTVGTMAPASFMPGAEAAAAAALRTMREVTESMRGSQERHQMLQPQAQTNLCKEGVGDASRPARYR